MIFPHAQQAKEEFRSKLAAYERTFEALRSSMRLLVNVEDTNRSSIWP
jgi:hypothetical protein